MSRPQHHTERDPQLTRLDLEFILLENQRTFIERWLCFPDCMTAEAQDFLTDLVSWLKGNLNKKKEVANG